MARTFRSMIKATRAAYLNATNELNVLTKSLGLEFPGDSDEAIDAWETAYQVRNGYGLEKNVREAKIAFIMAGRAWMLEACEQDQRAHLDRLFASALGETRWSMKAEQGILDLLCRLDTGTV